MRLLILICFLFFVVSCATIDVPNIKAWVELPGSKQGFAVETVTKKEHLMNEIEWAEKRKGAIHLFSEDWAVLKQTIRKNCIVNKCEQAVGALDGLFLAIDHALKQVKQ